MFEYEDVYKEEEFEEKDPFEESYVVYGINYRYEHPNYVTVTEHCKNDSIVVTMPDNVQVMISNTGAYTVVLQNNETISINKDEVKMSKSTCNKCYRVIECNMNLKPLTEKSKHNKSVNVTDNFLYIPYNQNKVIRVDFGGNLYHDERDSQTAFCNCNQRNLNRYFVLNRDLSGSELFVDWRSNRFIDTLTNLDELDTDIKTENKINTCIMHPLFKNYTENLMMIYDIPMIGMAGNYQDADELFRSFDFDHKSIIVLRTPLFIYERSIYHLYLYKVIETIITGFYKILNPQKRNRVLEPSASLVQFLKVHTPIVKVSEIDLVKSKSVVKRKPYVSKLKNLRENTDYYKKLISDGIVPKYFQNVKGIMFGYINECLENAFGIIENKEMEKIVDEEKIELQEKEIKEGKVQYVDSKQSDLRCNKCHDEEWSNLYTSFQSINKSSVNTSQKETCICPATLGKECDGICNVTNVIYPQTELDESDTTMSIFHRKTDLRYLRPEFDEKCTALKLVKQLVQVKSGDLTNVTKDEMKKIVNKIIGNRLLNKDEETAIMHAVEVILLKSTREKALLSTVCNFISTVKNHINDNQDIFTKKNEKSRIDIEDVMIKISFIIYGLLEDPTDAKKEEALNKICKLFEDLKLTSKDAFLSLEMAIKCFNDNLNKKDATELYPIMKNSEIAYKIIETLEKVFSDKNSASTSNINDDNKTSFASKSEFLQVLKTYSSQIKKNKTVSTAEEDITIKQVKSLPTCIPSTCCDETSGLKSFTHLISITELPIIKFNNEMTTAQFVVNKIFTTLEIEVEKTNAQLLTRVKISEVVQSILQHVLINRAGTKEVMKVAQQYIIDLVQQPNNLLDTALNLLEEIKEETEFISFKISTTSYKAIDEMAVKASLIMYSVLDSPTQDNKAKASKDVKKIFESAKLTSNEIELILNMTTDYLTRDIHGSMKVKGLFPKLHITSNLAIAILEDLGALLEDITMNNVDISEATNLDSIDSVLIRSSNYLEEQERAVDKHCLKKSSNDRLKPAIKSSNKDIFIPKLKGSPKQSGIRITYSPNTKEAIHTRPTSLTAIKTRPSDTKGSGKDISHKKNTSANIKKKESSVCKSNKTSLKTKDIITTTNTTNTNATNTSSNITDEILTTETELSDTCDKKKKVKNLPLDLSSEEISHCDLHKQESPPKQRFKTLHCSNSGSQTT